MANSKEQKMINFFEEIRNGDERGWGRKEAEAFQFKMLHIVDAGIGDVELDIGVWRTALSI